MEIKELEKVEQVGIFGKLSQAVGHEQVVFCHDEATGLESDYRYS